MIDTTRLGTQLTRQFSPAQVTVIPAGSTYPKAVTVRLLESDGAAQQARYWGNRELTVGDVVMCRRDPNDHDALYIDEPGGFGGGLQNNFTATTDPTVDDDSEDGYEAGSMWINTVSGAVFVCVDASVGAWEQFSVDGHTHQASNVAVSGTFDGHLAGLSPATVQAALEILDDVAGSGVTDHGALDGLVDDDHPQYHNDARGDGRYLKLTDYTDANVLAKVKNVDGSGSGLDADVFRGKSITHFVFGQNSTKTTNISNFNDILPSGFYDGYQATGSPTATWYHLINTRHYSEGSQYQAQIAAEFFDSPNLFYRIISNGIPTTWFKMWHAGNDGSGSGLDADSVDGYQATDLKLRGKTVYRSSNLAIPASTWVTVGFDNYFQNSAGSAPLWDGNTALYAGVTGWYIVYALVRIDPTSNCDSLVARLVVNSSQIIDVNQQRRTSNTMALNLTLTKPFYFNANDFVQLQVLVSPGAANLIYEFPKPYLGMVY